MIKDVWINLLVKVLSQVLYADQLLNLRHFLTASKLPPGYPCSHCLLATASAKRTGTLS